MIDAATLKEPMPAFETAMSSPLHRMPFNFLYFKSSARYLKMFLSWRLVGNAARGFRSPDMTLPICASCTVARESFSKMGRPSGCPLVSPEDVTTTLPRGLSSFTSSVMHVIFVDSTVRGTCATYLLINGSDEAHSPSGDVPSRNPHALCDRAIENLYIFVGLEDRGYSRGWPSTSTIRERTEARILITRIILHHQCTS